MDEPGKHLHRSLSESDIGKLNFPDNLLLNDLEDEESTVSLNEETNVAHAAITDSCTSVKKRTAGERRNYYKVYNELVRRAYNQSPFLPEIGVRPATRQKRTTDEPQVCCYTCRLQCGLIWFAFIDVIISGLLTFIFIILVAVHSPTDDLRYELTLVFSMIFLALSIMICTGVTRMKKIHILLWVFVGVNIVLLLVCFIAYYVVYYVFPGWQLIVGTILVVIFKTYQTYMVILYIRSPQKKYLDPKLWPEYCRLTREEILKEINESYI